VVDHSFSSFYHVERQIIPRSPVSYVVHFYIGFSSATSLCTPRRGVVCGEASLFSPSFSLKSPGEKRKLGSMPSSFTINVFLSFPFSDGSIRWGGGGATENARHENAAQGKMQGWLTQK